MLELAACSDAEIETALGECERIIEEKPPNTRASTGFWKAVENRQRLRRELSVRGIEPSPLVPLPDDRLPMIEIA